MCAWATQLVQWYPPTDSQFGSEFLFISIISIVMIIIILQDIYPSISMNFTHKCIRENRPGCGDYILMMN